MTTDKKTALYNVDEPVTDADYTGASVSYLEPDDDPVTDVDFTGASISSIEADDFVYTERNSIDAYSEGAESDHFVFSTVSYQDPLGDVELGDSDDTGICLHYMDADDYEDYDTDVDVTGRGISHLAQ